MPSITISSNAKLYPGNPPSDDEIVDHEVLRSVSGIHSDDELCCEYIDPELTESLGLTGGRIRFYFDEKLEEFRVSTCYGAEKEPSSKELSELVNETQIQWADGVGAGFFDFLDHDVPSKGLLTAILHQEPDFDKRPEYCVDASPSGQQEPVVKWSEQGTEHAPMLADLETQAEKGNAQAQAMLGSHLLNEDIAPGRGAEGITWLEKSAEQDDEWALMTLASAYLEGRGGTKVDVEKGVGLYQKAIDNGSVMALSALGEAYKEGKGVAKDPKLALDLLNRGCEGGNPVAMAELGDCYEFGIGVPIDLKIAEKWYKESVEMGFDPVEPALKRVQLQLNSNKGFFARILSLFKPKATGDVADTPDENFVLRKADDPELAAAMAEAQSTLNDFIAELPKLKPTQTAALKVSFREGSTVEHMWITDVRFDTGHFWGELANDPELLKKMKCGDPQKVHPNDVDDWMISEPSGKYRGGFTVKVLTKRS